MRVKKPQWKSGRGFGLTLLIGGALMVLFSGIVTDYARGFFAPDGIYIPHPTHKFSKQDAKGGVHSHTFRIYNLRPRRLAVQVEPDCGCTGVSWHKASIAPFGWKDLSATMAARKSELNQQSSVAIALRTDSRDKPLLFAFLVA